MTLDENDLRAGLRALTADPPPAPADRAAGSVRRSRTLRLRRTGFAVATAAGVALFAVVTRGAGTAPVPEGPLATALLEWPERYGEGGREFAPVARQHAATREGYTDGVRVLYAGKVGALSVAVLARCDATACTELAFVSQVPERSPQIVRGGRLEPAAKEQPIGWYLPAAEGSTLFVLGPPGSRHLRGDGIDVTDRDGVFAAGIGWRTSFLDLRVEDPKSRTVVAGRPGLPGVDPRDAVPYAQPPTNPVRVPEGFRAGPSYVGQTGIDGGDWHEAFMEQGSRGTYGVFLACVGRGEATVLTHTLISEAVSCDGVPYGGPVDDTGQPGGSFMISAEDPFTTYYATVGYPE